MSLHLSCISTNDNPADSHSRRLSTMDSKLCPALWKVVEQQFGGPTGHTCDLMTLDSNAMKEKFGKSLPHFTPSQTPVSSGVNLFAQDLNNNNNNNNNNNGLFTVFQQKRGSYNCKCYLHYQK